MQTVITRQVTRILSPGTLVDDIYIDDERAIYLLAVKEKWESSGDELPSYGVCFVDTATGTADTVLLALALDVYATANAIADPERNLAQARSMWASSRTTVTALSSRLCCCRSSHARSCMRKRAPMPCAPRKPCSLYTRPPLWLRQSLFTAAHPRSLCVRVQIKRNVNQPTLTRRRPGDQFWNASTTVDFLEGAEYFEGKQGGEGWPSVLSQLMKDHREAKEGSDLCLSALGGAVSYLKELYLDKEVLAQGLIKTYSGSTFDSPNLVLDSKAIKNLEIFENTVDGKVARMRRRT
jgi:hypothetical protein